MTDIITLRPEIRLCYIGIGAKCFEILESRDKGSRKKGDSSADLTDEASASAEALGSSTDGAIDDVAQAEDAVEGETSEEEDDDDDDDDSDDENTPTSATDPDESQTEEDEEGSEQDGEDEDSDDDDDDFVEPNKGGVKLRLREILFYDDKVAIFKARHGKL